jgi:hypothetical protein
MVNVTVPVAFDVAPVSVAVSLAVFPTGIAVADSCVLIEGPSLVTVVTSEVQALVTPMLLPSPE